MDNTKIDKSELTVLILVVVVMASMFTMELYRCQIKVYDPTTGQLIKTSPGGNVLETDGHYSNLVRWYQSNASKGWNGRDKMADIYQKECDWIWNIEKFNKKSISEWFIWSEVD